MFIQNHVDALAYDNVMDNDTETETSLRKVVDFLDS